MIESKSSDPLDTNKGFKQGNLISKTVQCGFAKIVRDSAIRTKRLIIKASMYGNCRQYIWSY